MRHKKKRKNNKIEKKKKKKKNEKKKKKKKKTCKDKDLSTRFPLTIARLRWHPTRQGHLKTLPGRQVAMAGRKVQPLSAADTNTRFGSEVGCMWMALNAHIGKPTNRRNFLARGGFIPLLDSSTHLNVNPSYSGRVWAHHVGVVVTVAKVRLVIPEQVVHVSLLPFMPPGRPVLQGLQRPRKIPRHSMAHNKAKEPDQARKNIHGQVRSGHGIDKLAVFICTTSPH